MNEVVEKTASFSIVEKKPQRPGGCVGIFFELFDWNRRFAKKKLFSKKLLPSVRLKQAAKKSGCNEKQPKLRLIADENSGGFPSARKNNRGTNLDLEQRHEMRAPSLVARLMGLESMPALHRDKSKKLSGKDKLVKLVDNIHGYSKEEPKNELRPQKLQKTSFCEKQQVTRFGTETLQFKNVLSRSKKHHHQKLPVPVKSPRNLSRKNASKLIGAAATRILEPGLQTSRKKYALNYTNTPHVPPKGSSLMGETTLSLSSLASEGQPSCKKCGHSLDNQIPKPCGNEKPLIFSSPSHSLGFSYERTKPGISAYYGEFGDEFSSDPKTQSQNQTFRPMGRVSQRSNFKSQPCERVPIATSDDEAKNILSFNRSSSGSTNPRVSSRINNEKFEMEKRISNRQNEMMSPGRKRRPTNISRQSETSILTNSTVKKQTCGSTKEDNNGVSFTFNSRSKQRSEVRAVARKGVQNDSRFNNITSQMSPFSENDKRNNNNNNNNKFDKSFPLNGDALGALLEQKLRELNSQGEDIGENAPRKTTAMILQELIAALTSETPFLHKYSEDLFHGEVNISDRSHFSTPSFYTSSKVNEMVAKSSVNQPLDTDHLSPGSVLEAYFSNNESCLSSSFDDSSGYKMLNSELWDSATSITTRKSSNELVINILNSVSEILCCVNLDLKEAKLNHAKEVLLNSELMFQNAVYSGSVERKGCFSVKDILLNEMGTLATVLWMNFGSSIGVDDCKEVNQLKRFAFDSIVEYLEFIFERYLKSGCKMSRKLPRCINSNTLLFEIVQEVRRWEHFSEFVLDELIETEMSLSLGKWTQCKSDRFDTSMEISKHVFQIVLDEILADLCSS